jgi:tetratricopeptide (TPR) repeat protein
VLETLSAKYPQQAVIYFAQSLAAMQIKNMELAATKIQRVLTLRPDWDKALIFQAQIAALSGDMEKAKVQLKSTAQKYPKNNSVKKLLAQVLIKEEAYEEAIKIYQGILANEPKDSESQLALGLIHLQLGQDETAELVFKKLLEQPERQYQASFYLGKLAEKKGQTQDALRWFDRVSDGPFVFDASVAAVALLAKNKQFDVADSRLKQLKMQFPKQEMRILLTQAELYNQQKQYAKAFKLLSDALAKQPEQTDLLYTRALIAEHVGKLDVLESDLRKILAKEPNNVAALNALGYTLLDHANRYAEAEKYLQQAIKLQPNEAVIMDSYGWLQFKLGRLDAALDYLQRAYNKQPENEIAAHLVEILWMLNKKQEARELFDKAIKATPNDEYLLDVKQRILK